MVGGAGVGLVGKKYENTQRSTRIHCQRLSGAECSGTRHGEQAQLHQSGVYECCYYFLDSLDGQDVG